jgi:methylenetetrahydrofolate reductase (NADPH)
MRAETDLEPMAHLTCQGHTRDEVAALLVDHRRRGVENILALGGDPPLDGTPSRSDYRFALDLVREVAATGSFSIGVAAHPEVHPRSESREMDRRHLAEKLELADFAITQFFFDVDHYLRLVDELAALGVDKPIVPGVMPFVNASALRRMAEMNGTDLPGWLTERLDVTDGPAEVRRLGVEVATRLSDALLDAGAPGLHLYALNRAETVKEVCANLGLAPG